MIMETGVEIRSLDETGFRCAVVIGGVVRYVGSYENCSCFLQSKLPREDRQRQDQMLIRATR
jgi:hypothetical protein